MSRRILPLTLDRLAEATAPCRSCLFWELDPVRRGRVPAAETAAVKEALLGEVLRDWGSCGRAAVVDDRAVGLILYMPASYAPGAHSYPTAPISPDAVLLTSVWVDPEYAGGGLGRMLVQGMARDLLRRGGIRAVEAFGDVGAASAIAGALGQGGRCAAPAEFLARVGFKTHRAHPTAPRLRMDLSSAVTWRDEVEAVLGKLLGAVRPHHQPHPHPVPRAGAHQHRVHRPEMPRGPHRSAGHGG